ncbi:MAG TPA: hypothetical protein VJU80_09005 [Solirubrobacteraceae bacterium]|nr:hypothetical protein [Solirubrobacteraceae bacterium]
MSSPHRAEALRTGLFGLDHPTWSDPACFYYKSAEQARDVIREVYGPDAEHVVVEIRYVTEEAS